jgi:hypothetical protein
MRAEIQRLARIAGSESLAGKPVDSEVERIALLRRVLAELPNPLSPAIAQLTLITLVCLGVASFAWRIRIPKTRIDLTVKASSATFTFARTLGWRGSWPIAPGPIRLQGVSTVRLPLEFGVPVATLSKPIQTDLVSTGKHLSLDQFDIVAKSRLTVERDEAGTVEISAIGDLSADLAVDGRITGTARSKRGPSHSFRATLPGPPGFVEFRGIGSRSEPVVLRMTPKDTFVLREARVTDLTFWKAQNGVANHDPVSAILSGTLIVTDSGKRIDLSEGSELNFPGSEGVVHILKVGPSGIALSFSGSTSHLTLGAGDFEENLKPTYLEFLFYQKPLGVLWAAFAFLWSLLWSGRKLLLSDR